MLALATVLSIYAGPPLPELQRTPKLEEVPTVVTPPRRWINGTGALAVGGTVKVLSLGAGITGIVLGGSPGLLLTVSSTATTTLGGGLLVTGAWLRARHQGWYDERDLLGRVRTARRVGWPLFGVGLGLLAGSSVALALWPFGPCYDDGCAARYPGGFATVESVFVVAPLLIGAGASALTWSATYPRARGHRIELSPALGGLSMRF